MSLVDVEERPKKKRRFFAEDPPTPPEERPETFILPLNSTDALSEVSPNAGTKEASVEHFKNDSSQSDLKFPEEVTPATDHPEDGFDKQLFESFIGSQISDDSLRRLQEVAGGNLERAINIYLDGSWKSSLPSAPPPSTIRNAFNSGLPRHVRSKPTPQELRSKSPPKATVPLPSMPDARYVGAFGVAGWATRSGPSLLRHGEAVKIERTKIKPPVKVGRGGKAIQPSKMSAARMRTDIIVRFTNAKGEEVGRLPKETAAWVSTLMDQRVCRFDGTCVFAEDRVRVNDTIYLQLRCSLLRRAFEAGGFVKPENNNRTTGIFEEKETSEEKDLRLRQVALVKLFDEINLHPATVNETTAKHKRDGILQAAEIAEQYDKDAEDKKKQNNK